MASPGCATYSGNLALFDMSYLAATQLVKSAPGGRFAYTWHLVPNRRRGRKVQMVGGHHVSIPMASRHQDEAWHLSEHLLSDMSMKTLFDGCGFLVATKRLLEDPSWLVDAKQYPGLDWQLNSIKQADEFWGRSADPIQDYVNRMWSEANGAVGSRQKTIDQALSDLQKACTEQLATVLKA